jgi:hypothetical protein
VHLVGTKHNSTKMHGIHGIKIADAVSRDRNVIKKETEKILK